MSTINPVFKYREASTALIAFAGVNLVAALVNSFVFGSVGFSRFCSLTAPIAIGTVVHLEIGFNDLGSRMLDGLIEIGFRVLKLYAKLVTRIC